MMPRGTGYACRALLTACFLLMLANGPARSQPASPPPPARYRASLRYNMPSPRDQHVLHYDKLIEYLKSLKFEFLPPLDELPETDREDPTKNVMTGVLPSSGLLKVLSYPDVAAVLLTPLDYKLPNNPGEPVKVRLELASGLGPQRQQVLADQTRLLLMELGFREAVGYDQHGLTGRPFTRLVGTVPAGALPALLKDVRRQPAGWFAPRFAPEDLPLPLREVSPIVVTEVVPDPEPLKEPLAPPARGNPNLDKIGPSLWALVSRKDPEAKPLRMEIILAYDPPEEDSWHQAFLKAAPGLVVEGRLGPIITVVARPGQVPAFASLPIVSVVRLPRPARVAVAGTVPLQADNAAALRLSGLRRLHDAGYRGKVRGQPVRLAVIDSDFRGYEALAKAGKLPPDTQLIDLTTEGNPRLVPEPRPAPLTLPSPPAPGGDGSVRGAEPATLGHGTQCALAAFLAAPEVRLTLIRVDPAAPYQVRTAARYIHGDTVGSENLRRRVEELVRERAALRQRRSVLQQEREAILNNYEDEADFERSYGILGAARAWVFSEREWHALRQAEWDRAAQELREREQRYLRLVSDLASLKGIQIVACALVWNDGYPLGGASPLSRALDQVSQKRNQTADRTANPVLWFQAAGDTRGQSWAGPWEDRDGNGVMEFADPQTPFPAGRWTTELNFLGWQPYEAAAHPDFPDGMRVRISLQWREPHDPSVFFRPDEPDLYRQPLAALRLVVLRQRDPEGKTVGADAFEVLARSSDLPQRLDNLPSASTYEQAVEFTAVKGARYALRLERQRPSRWEIVTDPETGRPLIRQREHLTPTGVRPLGTPTLPALEPRWELHPRLFVAAVGGAALGLGRPIFLDFPTDAGSIGVPADGQEVITVGAADFSGKAEPFSASGPPANLGLLLKPDVLAFDRLAVGARAGERAYGTSLSTPFAAGLAATLLSAGTPYQQIHKMFHPH
jgi:hypothetical protein